MTMKKYLLTILMAIPTMVFSFFGMNIGPSMSGALPLADNMIFVSIFTVIITAIVGIILYKKDMRCFYVLYRKK